MRAKWRRTKKRSARPAGGNSGIPTPRATNVRSLTHAPRLPARMAVTTTTTASTRDVLIALTRSDVKSRYGRGPLRMVKWVADPFAALGVYLALIALVIDRPGIAPGLSIACAVVPFQLLMSTCINASRAVELRRSIVANMGFRRILIPVSSAMTELVGFTATLLILPIMMAVYTVAPTPAILLLPVMIAVT